MADINELISPKALDDIQKLESSVDRIAKGLYAIFDAAKASNAAISGIKPTELDKIAAAQKKVAENAKALGKEEEKLLGVKKKQFDAEKKLREEVERAVKIEKDRRKATEELNKQRQKAYEAIAKQEYRERELKKQMDASGDSLMALRARTNALTSQRDKLDRSTKEGREEFKLLTKEIKQNNAELLKLDQQIGRSQRNVGNYGTALKGLAGTFGVGLGAAGLVSGIKTSIERTAQLDDAFADVMKTTGLTREEVKTLYKELISFDTRTGAAGLLGIAEAAGRMNIAKGDLSSFVKTVDQVFVALGDSLGGDAEEIATQLAKISAQFGLEAEFGVAEGINKIGSAINDLGAKTKASEAPIIDFTNRLVGLASSMDLNIADITALGALLDANGQSMEVSGTAISQLLIKMSQDTSTFAELAGMSVKDFEKLLRDDAIKALMQLSKNLKETSRDPIGMARAFEQMKLEGQRTVAVLGVLSQNTEQYADYQKIANNAIIEGTSLSAEFNIKNNTLAASLDKLNNSWQALLAQESGGGFFKGIINFANDTLLKVGNMDVIFSRSSKLTQEQIGRTTDLMLRLSGQTYDEFRALYAGFEKLTMQDLIVSKESIKEKLDDLGLNNRESELIYGEFLRRKSKQVAEAAAKDTAKEKEEVLKRLESEQKISEAERTDREKASTESLKITEKANAEILKMAKDLNEKAMQASFENNIMLLQNREATALEILGREEQIMLESIKNSEASEKVKQEAISAVVKSYEAQRLAIRLKNINTEWEASKKISREALDYLAGLEADIDKAIEAEIDADFNAFVKAEEKKRAEAEKTAKARLDGQKMVADAAVELGTEVVNAIFEINRRANDAEIAQLEVLRDKKIITEEQYDSKLKAIRAKQARRDRAQAIFNATITTAEAVVKALSSTVPPFNFILASLVGALGAVQIGLIAGQPLPAFAKGTENAPEGLARVAEQGRELLLHPDGTLQLTGNKEEVRYLAAGTKVIPNRQTEEILQSGAQAGRAGDVVNNAILRKLNTIRSISIVPDKSKIVDRKGNYYRTYINAKIR